MLRRHIPLLILLPAMLLMAGCSSSRRQAMSPTGGNLSAPVAVAEVSQRISALAAGADAMAWQSLSVPVSVKVHDSGLPKVSGTLTLVRDREIRLSLRFLGMEMGALSVTADSIRGYLKMQKLYLSESTADIAGGFPLTVGNLQSLLTGALFTIGKPAFDIAEASITHERDNIFTITPSPIGAGLDYCFSVELTGPDAVTGAAFVHGSRYALARYSDFRPFGRNTTLLPSQIDLSAAGKEGHSVGATLYLNIDRAATDTDLSLRPFVIPQGYRRISAASLIKVITEL